MSGKTYSVYNAALHCPNQLHNYPVRPRPLEREYKLSEHTLLAFSDKLRQAFPFLLLAAYGVFLCSYFIFEDYSEPYRFFARVVFSLGIFVFFRGIRDTWRHPAFLAMAIYMLYLLCSGLWSDPLDWYRLGQKLTISIYLLSFIAITHFLNQWNGIFFERMLQLCTLFAAVAASISIVIFYSENSFPGTRLMGIGSLTNINEFANVYGVFALLAMSFALRCSALSQKLLFIFTIVVFICVAWFGQSRTAFTSLMISILLFLGLMLKVKKLWYAATLTIMAGIAALALTFPDALEGALLRGEGLRPLIWTEGWRQAISRPIVGHGIISEIAIETGGQHFNTVHNAYLQVFWQSGAIGLSFFMLLLVVAFRNAWSLGRQQEDYTVFCLLIFAVCTMMTGVDTLIARPRDQWMLFWFPLALLISYQSTISHSQLHSTHPTSSPAPASS
jgi:O-antigen ligase